MSAADELPSRGEGRGLELQCPACNSWRLAFLVTATPQERLDEVNGAAWVCDVERSRWHREAQAAAYAAAQALLPPAYEPQRLWQLLTVPEHIAARQANDALVSVAFDRINARRDPLPLNDGNFIALVLRLTELQVLTQQRAGQVLAGQFPA